MTDRITWKAEVEFEGSPEDFNKFTEVMQSMPVAIHIPEWPRPRPFPGLEPFEAILGKELLARFIGEKRPLALRFPKDIAGGIRDAHFHIGGEVFLFDREQFAEVIGQAARQLAEQRAAMVGDYVEVVSGLEGLAVNR